jgi:hypothetical protein
MDYFIVFFESFLRLLFRYGLMAAMHTLRNDLITINIRMKKVAFHAGIGNDTDHKRRDKDRPFFFCYLF